ncbi:MAG: LytTR family DNA-binding domain-containing protein [Peptococcaceae bacterium]|nr:LytTR family DNA-binding domain-containing protein [Peptococcaceae bacterium]
MKVVICDDDREFCAQLRARVIDHFGDDVHVAIYNDGQALLDAYATGARYDVAFMDIEIGTMNGTSVGKTLRGYDKDLIIVFITAYPSYAADGSECEMFRFIPKSQLDEKLDKTFAAIEAKLNERCEYVYLTDDSGDTTRYLTNDILYAEVARNFVTVHFCNGDNLRLYTSLKAIQERLPAPVFVQIHRSFIVNLRHVQTFGKKHLVLDQKDPRFNGEKNIELQLGKTGKGLVDQWKARKIRDVYKV